MSIKSTLFQGIVALTLLAASNVTHAAFFDMFLTVTGGPSQGNNGTPDSFSGSFEIDDNKLDNSKSNNVISGSNIKNFSVTFNNVWDAGLNSNVTQSFSTPTGNFQISFSFGVLSGFSFTSLESVPLDFFIDYQGGAFNGSDWDLITDSTAGPNDPNNLLDDQALWGTLSVAQRNGNDSNGQQVAEPEMLALIGFGLTGLAGAARRRSSRRNKS